MICILPVGSRFDQGFFSRYSESDTLLLFSSFYGVQDVVVMESASDSFLPQLYRVKQILLKSRYKFLVTKLRNGRKV